MVVKHFTISFGASLFLFTQHILHYHEIFVDLHVLVNPDMKVVDAHDLQHKVEGILKTKFGNYVSAIIHVEPFLNKK